MAEIKDKVISAESLKCAIDALRNAVGQQASGTASLAVNSHNTAQDAHGDIRLLLKELTDKVTHFLDVDDATVDELSEVLTLIENNKGTLESLTANKVNVSDIVNNLTTNVSNKPLSAAQGVALKALIDAITIPTRVSQLDNDKGYLTSYTESDPTVPSWAKASTKPSYTASEVGASPTGHKHTKSDIADFPPIPSGVSEVAHQYAVSNSKDKISDVTTWNNIANPLTQRQRACVYGNGYYIVCGTSGEIAYSLDGVTWISIPKFTSDVITGIAYGKGTFVAIDSGGLIWIAEETPFSWESLSVTWELIGSGVTAILEGICYANNRFVLVGEPNLVAFSDNGRTWTETSVAYNFKAVTFGEGKYVGAGNSGAVAVSYDGENWTDYSDPSITGSYRAAAFGAGRFVIGCQGGIIRYSDDGRTWTTATTNSASSVNYIRGIIYAEGKFYAVMYVSTGKGEIWVSEDAEAWTVQQVTSGRLWCCAYGDGIILTSGDNGDVYALDLGIVWLTKQPELASGQYLWERIVFTLSDGSKVIGDSVFIEEASVSSVNGKTGDVQLSADDVGADKNGEADSKVRSHNVDDSSHNDIRLLIEGLTTRLNTLANSDDTTLDQMAEVVAYIKSNRDLISQITTNKVNVSDIVNDLVTNVSNKPLSAAQGVALKVLIDAIVVPTKIGELTNDIGYLTSFTEIDPTVPAWAKAASKPTYTAGEVGAVSYNPQTLTEDQKAQVRSNIGAGASSFSGNYDDLHNKPSSLPANGGDADTVDGKHASDFALKGDIPSSLPASDVYSWAKAQNKPTYTASEVGLGNVANERQYSASNPPPYPVTSVNGKTGAVQLGAGDVGADPAGSAVAALSEAKEYADNKVDELFGMVKVELPSGYTQIEYIESTGTQYIDTGVIGKSGISAALDFTIISANLDDFIPLGSATGDWSTRCYPLALQNGGCWAYGAGEWCFSDVKASTQIRYRVETSLMPDSQLMKVDGVPVVSSSYSGYFNTGHSVYLFGNNYSDISFMSAGSIRVYSCKIYENGVCTRNFVPCVDANGTSGLYDIVNNTFYTDGTGGEFARGSAVHNSVLSVSNGGTGATDAATARANLGITPTNIGASPTGHKHSKSEITDFPTSMTPTAHSHSKSEITDLTTETWTFTLEDGSTVTKEVYVG